MFKINTAQDMISDTSNTNQTFIGSSGVYDVEINFASIAVAASGAEQIVFNLNYNNKQQTIYGPFYKGKDGSYLDIGTKLYTTLGVIAGLEDGDEFTVEPETHEVGKDNKELELDVIQELTELPIKVQVQMEYSVYQGNIQERPVIRAFFNEEGASAEEIINGGETGKRLATILDKFADKNSYRDELTKEDVDAWIADGRNKNKASTPAPKAKSASAKTGGMFSKKR